MRWYKCIKWNGQVYVEGKVYKYTNGHITDENGGRDSVNASWVKERFTEVFLFSDYLSEVEKP